MDFTIECEFITAITIIIMYTLSMALKIIQNRKLSFATPCFQQQQKTMKNDGRRAMNCLHVNGFHFICTRVCVCSFLIIDLEKTQMKKKKKKKMLFQI